MIERIAQLQRMTLAGEMWVEPVPTEYDRKDLFLRHVPMSAKRVCEYILNQEPLVTEFSTLTGLLKFDGSVEGDLFNRAGHAGFALASRYFYNKPVDNVATFEWQHSTGDFGKIIDNGLKSILEEIEESIRNHSAQDELDFLYGIRDVTHAMIGWAQKCSCRAAEKALTVENSEYKANLTRLSQALMRVPYEPASSFYEAVLSLYVCYPFVPDSIGTVDRYLYPYYRKDIDAGKITREEAAAYLQELFLMLQARISIKSDRFTRGGESHFCIGGYLPNGEDGFTDLSRLVLDSLLELDTFIPQISLRWTKKMNPEDFRYVNERARKDNNMRIAFVNDEPRIRGWMEIAGMSYEDAVSYTMVGCNEPALQGGMIMGTCNCNIAKFIEKVFYERRDEILSAKTFEEFYAVCEEELQKNLDEILYYDRVFNELRARDCNLVSSIFFRGCIKNARSITQGGGDFTTAMIDVMGITTAVDSLMVAKQFVFDDRLCTMRELTDALDHNWDGYEDLRTLILKKTDFFGNDGDESNAMAIRFYESMYQYLKDKTDWVGKHYMVGDLIGYNQHNAWFGEAMRATPDGRHAGDVISFGRGQSLGKDRNGLTALLNAVAHCDPHTLVCGPTVTNIMLDEKMVTDDASYAKLVTLLGTYFKNGGMHYQLSYVTREKMVEAQKEPSKYKTLRVRVSGFSDFFVRLDEDLQNEIITRTSHAC